LHGIQWILEAEGSAKEYETECSHAGAQLEGDEVLNIIKDALALFNGSQDR
jgi:hypothetical protein